MTVLSDYNQFGGRHWETGSVHNHFAYRGITVEHTGEAPSEALLMGVSGGAVFGYFSFAYEGYDPMVALLTRNTFDPLEKMLSRLGIVQNVVQTSKAEKGVINLINELEEGVPPIVWADFFTLPYNVEGFDEGMWGAFPIVVYGYDQAGGVVHVADRAGVGLEVPTEAFNKTRTRIKNVKNKLITLDPLRPEKVREAVTAGIWETISLYTEKPPKGSKNSFGFNGYKHWIKLLTKPKQKQSWANVFPRGAELYAGLSSAYDRVVTFGQSGCGADRHTYAAFLREAATVIEKPALNDVADIFMQSAGAWCEMTKVLLPDSVEPLAKTRELKKKQLNLFINEGSNATAAIAEIKAGLKSIRDKMGEEYPLSPAEVEQHQQQIADQVQVIHDIELEGINLLQGIMA